MTTVETNFSLHLKPLRSVLDTGAAKHDSYTSTRSKPMHKRVC